MTNPNLAFTCNICGQSNIVEINTLQRDAKSCSKCQSSVRFRWIIHSLSTCLFGKSLLLENFPYLPSIKGIGLSDEPLYSIELAKRLGYLNTFYHCEPKLDIKNLTANSPSSLDFIIASEVFEHIPYPVQPAFDNLNRLLKPGGVVLFSTPWRPRGYTVEHFANLYEWSIIDWHDSKILLNRTRSGALEAFSTFSFHGGAGDTLEMRLFSRPSLEENFRAAHLDVEFVSSSYLEYGIVLTDCWSLPCVATKSGELSKDKEDSIEINTSEVTQEKVRHLYHELDSLTAWSDILERKTLKLERELNEAAELAGTAGKERELIRKAKWIRLGRRFGLGPRL